MKVAIPLGRLNKRAKEIIENYFGLSYSFFNEKKEREFLYKKEDYEFYFLKPKDLMKFCEQFNIDYAVISNDYYFNYQNNKLFNIIEHNILGIQRLSLITNGNSLENITKIVTPYNLIAKTYYPDKEILNFNSSLEIYPNIDSNCGIIDIVETGSTIKIHNLKEIQQLLQTEVLLIKNKLNTI